MLISKTTLVGQLAPVIDAQLAHELVEEYISQERRFIQRDWEPSQLDGGQFCEVLARILYHRDSGNLNRNKDFSDCLGYIEEDKNAHHIQPRHDALHLAKVLRTIYKFRSQRGAVHISPTYKPNHMDSKLVLEGVRWSFADTLRIFWQGKNREEVAAAIRELLQFEVPAIGKFEDVLLVQRTDLSAAEEVLILLHYAGEQGFSQKQLTSYVQHDRRRVGDAIKSLSGPALRQIVQLPSGCFRLTDLGSKYVREKLADKLILE